MSTAGVASNRNALPRARRVVVKVGSSSITSLSGGLSTEAIGSLVDALASAYGRGVELVLVSSGAIAAGLAPLELAKRPRDLATQQAAASVGQGLLVARYTGAFAGLGITASQVLLTAEDLMRRQQHANAFRALERLLNLKVLPIVNENDTVATHEIRFGDNDRLAALVAHLIKAEALLLLSDVDALYDGPPSEGALRVPFVEDLALLESLNIGGTGSAGLGTGGMKTKVEAATIAAASGIPTLLTSAKNIAAAFAGDDVGTWFEPTGAKMPVRKLWLAHLASTKGSLTLDAGAVRAVTTRRRSLLAAGITKVTGHFDAGDAVDLVDESGAVVARGLVGYADDDLPQMLGRSTRELGAELGHGFERAVVHADDLVLL